MIATTVWWLLTRLTESYAARLTIFHSLKSLFAKLKQLLNFELIDQSIKAGLLSNIDLVSLMINSERYIQYCASYYGSPASFDVSITFKVCGGDIILPNGGGKLTSPNNPQRYPSNVNCLWRIRFTSGRSVSVKFENFELEDSSNCQKDYVLVSWCITFCLRSLSVKFGSTAVGYFLFFSSKMAFMNGHHYWAVKKSIAAQRFLHRWQPPLMDFIYNLFQMLLAVVRDFRWTTSK